MPESDLAAYVGAASHYLENARSLLDREDADKAGEALWGALNQAAQVVHYSQKGHFLHEHREVTLFLRELVRATQNADWNNVRSLGEELHANFYHHFLTADDIRERFPKIQDAVAKLLHLAGYGAKTKT